MSAASACRFFGGLSLAVLLVVVDSYQQPSPHHSTYYHPIAIHYACLMPRRLLSVGVPTCSLAMVDLVSEIGRFSPVGLWLPSLQLPILLLPILLLPILLPIIGGSVQVVVRAAADG